MRQTMTEAKFDVNEVTQQEKALLRLLYDNARVGLRRLSPGRFTVISDVLFFFFTSGAVSN